MARIPYPDLSNHDKNLIEKIVSERGSVLHLYHILLHSPALAKGWLAFFTAVRQQMSISARLRELIIIYIAALNDAEYEASQHIPIALNNGATQAEVDAVLSNDSHLLSILPSVDQLALRYTYEMTRNIQVSQELFDEISHHFDHQKMVELTAIIGAYNLASRFLEALQIKSTDKRVIRN